MKLHVLLSLMPVILCFSLSVALRISLSVSRYLVLAFHAFAACLEAAVVVVVVAVVAVGCVASGRNLHTTHTTSAAAPAAAAITIAVAAAVSDVCTYLRILQCYLIKVYK